MRSQIVGLLPLGHRPIKKPDAGSRIPASGQSATPIGGKRPSQTPGWGFSQPGRNGSVGDDEVRPATRSSHPASGRIITPATQARDTFHTQCWMLLHAPASGRRIRTNHETARSSIRRIQLVQVTPTHPHLVFSSGPTEPGCRSDSIRRPKRFEPAEQRFQPSSQDPFKSGGKWAPRIVATNGL